MDQLAVSPDVVSSQDKRMALFCIYSLNCSCVSLSTSTYSNVTLDSSLGLVDYFSRVCERLLEKAGLLPIRFNSTGTHNSIGKLKNVEISNSTTVANRMVFTAFIEQQNLSLSSSDFNHCFRIHRLLSCAHLPGKEMEVVFILYTAKMIYL